MEKFSFFNDINDDRVYYAEDFARHLKKYFTNGIFNNELKVIANNDMTITIQEGDANIEGYRYTNTGDLIKTIEMDCGHCEQNEICSEIEGMRALHRKKIKGAGNHTADAEYRKMMK